MNQLRMTNKHLQTARVFIFATEKGHSSDPWSVSLDI